MIRPRHEPHRDPRAPDVPCAGSGADPNADWLHGCAETDGKGALSLETSLSGVFAIGDVRAGSTKRVAAAVGEDAAVVAQIHALMADRAARLQPDTPFR